MEIASESLESEILFDVKDEALAGMTLSEHINRLSRMRDFLNTAITNNRINLQQLKQVSRNQTSKLQTSYQILQSQTKTELTRMKQIFEPSMNMERKQLSDMKNQVSKITAQQLTTKKTVLNCEAMVDHCENEMGYAEIKSSKNKN